MNKEMLCKRILSIVMGTLLTMSIVNFYSKRFIVNLSYRNLRTGCFQFRCQL